MPLPFPFRNGRHFGCKHCQPVGRNPVEPRLAICQLALDLRTALGSRLGVIDGREPRRREPRTNVVASPGQRGFELDAVRPRWKVDDDPANTGNIELDRPRTINRSNRDLAICQRLPIAQDAAAGASLVRDRDPRQRRSQRIFGALATAHGIAQPVDGRRRRHVRSAFAGQPVDPVGYPPGIAKPLDQKTIPPRRLIGFKPRLLRRQRLDAVGDDRIGFAARRYLRIRGVKFSFEPRNVGRQRHQLLGLPQRHLGRLACGDSLPVTARRVVGSHHGSFGVTPQPTSIFNSRCPSACDATRSPRLPGHRRGQHHPPLAQHGDPCYPLGSRVLRRLGIVEHAGRVVAATDRLEPRTARLAL